VADPDFEEVPVGALLSREYAEQCRGRINLKKAMIPASSPVLSKGSETVYVTAMDRLGNAASFISSLFMGFGSGLVVDGTGIVLQNRGNSFSLNPAHPNCIEPHKRPMHTIIPAMVFKDGRFVMSFGVMGGDMQPQGHVQLLLNLIDFGMNLQEAMDAPRVRHLQGRHIYVEGGVPSSTVLALQRMGHHVMGDIAAVNQVGGGQAVFLDHSQGVLLGASDRRKDGCAIGY
jgi:gamma-glutamyltranspeptidase/glutathione hydrolase